jgi:hypothetical protein
MVTISVMPTAFFNWLAALPWIKIHGYNIGHAYGIFQLA